MNDGGDYFAISLGIFSAVILSRVAGDDQINDIDQPPRRFYQFITNLGMESFFYTHYNH